MLLGAALTSWLFSILLFFFCPCRGCSQFDIKCVTRGKRRLRCIHILIGYLFVIYFKSRKSARKSAGIDRI